MLNFVIFNREDAMGLYYTSYLWYSGISCLTVIIVGMIVSLLTGPQDPRELNPDLILPLRSSVFCFLPHKLRKKLDFNVGANYVSNHRVAIKMVVIGYQRIYKTHFCRVKSLSNNLYFKLNLVLKCDL